MSPIRLRHITTPVLLRYIFGALMAGLLLAYVTYQARFFIAGPQIALDAEPPTVQTTQMDTLSGHAENITEISINGRLIHTDESGNFQEPVVLERGYTIVSIQAKDRYGRTTELHREFVYTPLSRANH